MRQYVPKVLLWLFVINLGIALGAGIYEQRVVISQWENIPPQTWPQTGVLFWVYVTTVPLTLLTLANLVAAWLDRGQGVIGGLVRSRSSLWSGLRPSHTSFRRWSGYRAPRACPKRRSVQPSRNGCFWTTVAMFSLWRGGWQH
jgi:hypothetical protein